MNVPNEDQRRKSRVVSCEDGVKLHAKGKGKIIHVH